MCSKQIVQIFHKLSTNPVFIHVLTNISPLHLPLSVLRMIAAPVRSGPRIRGGRRNSRATTDYSFQAGDRTARREPVNAQNQFNNDMSSGEESRYGSDSPPPQPPFPVRRHDYNVTPINQPVRRHHRQEHPVPQRRERRQRQTPSPPARERRVLEMPREHVVLTSTPSLPMQQQQMRRSQPAPHAPPRTPEGERGPAAARPPPLANTRYGPPRSQVNRVQPLGTVQAVVRPQQVAHASSSDSEADSGSDSAPFHGTAAPSPTAIIDLGESPAYIIEEPDPEVGGAITADASSVDSQMSETMEQLRQLGGEPRVNQNIHVEDRGMRPTSPGETQRAVQSIELYLDPVCEPIPGPSHVQIGETEAQPDRPKKCTKKRKNINDSSQNTKPKKSTKKRKNINDSSQNTKPKQARSAATTNNNVSRSLPVINTNDFFKGGLARKHKIVEDVRRFLECGKCRNCGHLFCRETHFHAESHKIQLNRALSGNFEGCRRFFCINCVSRSFKCPVCDSRHLVKLTDASLKPFHAIDYFIMEKFFLDSYPWYENVAGETEYTFSYEAHPEVMQTVKLFLQDGDPQRLEMCKFRACRYAFFFFFIFF